MILPERRSDRDKVYRNVIRQCEASREERRARYARLRPWYLGGTESGQQAMFNKIQVHIETSSAYLYAPETTRFSIANKPEYGDRFMDEEGAWRDELHRLFHDSGIGTTLGLAVDWSHVYESMFSKVFVSGGEVVVENIQNPSDLGVLQEDLPTLDEQEAVCQWYVMSLPRFSRLVGGDKELMRLAENHAGPQRGSASDTLSPAMGSLIIAASSPIMIGSAPRVPMRALAMPRVDEDVVELAELWIKDDALGGEYRVVTNFLPTEDILREAQNPLTPMELPFVQLCLMPVLDYLWGFSTIEGLLGLQAWRERRMADIDELLHRQLDPPLFGVGIAGDLNEKLKALRRAGGTFTSPMPGGDVKNMAPQMPPDAFAEIEAIDRMFAERGGLPQLLQGQGEPGLRAGNQASTLATLGSARLRRKAMLVESYVAAVATRVIRLHRRQTKGKLVKPDGSEFQASQIPGSFVALVSAHSASPLYAEQIAQKAVVLNNAKVLDPEDFVEMMDPPMAETLKVKARRRGKAQAEMAKKAMELKEAKAKADLEKAAAQTEKARHG